MMDWIINQVLNNQFLVGLSGATVIGALLFVLRSAPNLIWRGVLSLFSYEVEVKNNDNTFEWLVLWLARSEYAQRARRLRLSSRNSDLPVAQGGASIASGDYRYLLYPGMGWHFFLYQST